MKRLICLLVVVMFGQQVIAQSYPEERERFVKDFQRIMNEFIGKKQKDFIKDELAVKLLTPGEFSDTYFQQMVATCNLMETKKLKPYPDIFNYVFSVYSFVKNKQPNSSFVAWHSTVDKLLDARNIKKFTEFIEVSALFFSENKIAESANYEWYFYGDYVFEFTDRPLIRFTKGRLVCGVPNSDKRDRNDQRFLDSISISNTNGLYDLSLKKWEGLGGRISWVKVGLNEEETYADCNKMEISMKSSSIVLDSVRLTTPYFKYPIVGQLSERAFRKTRETDNVYPQFLSYEKRLTIKDLRQDMDYNGAFSMKGASFVGIGTSREPARLIVRRGGKTFISAEAQLFTVSALKIIGQNANTTMYLPQGDSIIHPGIEFYYYQEKDMIELVRGKTGVSQAPFVNSYHMVDMYVPKIVWERNSSDIFLTFGFETSQEQKSARLESRSYYDGRLYDKLQGMEQIHPLVAISRYCEKYDEYILDEGKIATAMSKTIEQAKPVILELASLGFLSYDSESKLVRVNDKVDNFINSRAGKRDYDNLQFVSDLRPRKLEGYSEEQIKENKYLQQMQARYQKQSEERRLKLNFGVFSLSTMEIKLEAVDQVRISDAQAAFVIPDSSKIILKKNRDFEFAGWASVGKFESRTLAANYTYASNKINLLKTGKSIFRVKPLTKADGNTSIAMITAIDGITGEILIDDANNRSGVSKTIVDYPKLKSTKAAKIYYNSNEIYRGAYDSTLFYFTCDPFEMDSLDNFKDVALRLKGELTSAGIFPLFREDLKIMPDYSFGFSSKAPAGGYDFYGTKAKYDNKIVLSGNGLQGAGKIDFVESTSISKAFTFLPDSTIGFAEFVNKPREVGVQFPDVKSSEAFITYVPRGNILKASSTPSEDLVFFNGEAKLKGTAVVRPVGMSGSGIMLLEKANIGSDHFEFKRWDVDADTAVFNLKNNYPESADEDPLAFKTDNVSAHVSFKDRNGAFESNNGMSTVTFPVNQYICRMDSFKWLMDDDAVTLEKRSENSDLTIDSDLDLVGPNFFSIHPEQDSLQFKAPKATFNLKDKMLYCTETAFIDVADARIFPDSARVIIRKKAKMDPLINSRIVANYITKYHNFLEARTEITARRMFNATALYPYYDADSNKTMLKMDKVSVDSTFQTFATGTVSSDADFKLNSQFDYYGKVGLKASNPLIFFTGATRINHTCAKYPRNWMSFNAQIDPQNIQIPVSETMKSLDGQAISAGIVWRDSRNTDSISLYPAFLSEVESETDPIVMTASGLLQYDFDTKEFQIGSREKLIDRGEPGNFIALNVEECSLNGNGKINLGMDFGDISVDAVGTMNYDQLTQKTSLNTTLRFNLPMASGVFEDISGRILNLEGTKPLELFNTTLEQAVLEWQDRKASDKLKEDYLTSTDKQLKRVPDALEKSIVLTGVRFVSHTKFGDQDRGFKTSLDGASIVNFYGKAVMRQVIIKCFMQQLYSSNKDHFALFFQVPGGSDYFMDYSMTNKDGLLSVFSNDEKLTASINGLKEDKRKAKNFKYEVTTNQVYLAKLLRLFE